VRDSASVPGAIARRFACGLATFAWSLAAGTVGPACDGERHEVGTPEFPDRVGASEPTAPDLPIDVSPAVPRGETLRAASYEARVTRHGAASTTLAQRVQRDLRFVRQLALGVGLRGWEFEIIRDKSAIIGALCAGDIDLLIPSSVVASQAIERCGARPVAIAAVGGETHYRSEIFVRRDSNIASLADLGQKTISFEHEQSTTAYGVPRMMLEDAGLMVRPFEFPPEPRTVRYRFAGEELNVIGDVVHGRVDAGALSSQNLRDYSGAEIRVVATSSPIPRLLVMTSPRLDPALIERMSAVLLEMHRDPKAKPALEAAGFEFFVAVAPGDLEVMRALHQRSPEAR
jgi:phosphonate transport system substrate-binding protein